MKRKYFAERRVTVNGKTYNPGDIIWHEVDLPGIRRALVPAKAVIQAKLPESTFFCAKDPKISVIVTFHNQIGFVSDCMESFKRQSIKVPYEMIVVVDQSTEGEASYVRSKYPHARIFEVDFGNANAARNFGLEQAQSDIVTFFDGDDYAYGRYLEKMHSTLVQSPETSFVYSRFEHDLFGLEKGNLPRCNIFEWSESWAKFSPITNTPVMIWRKECPRWDTQFKAFQDAAFGLELVARELKGKHIREKLWFYRHHKESSQFMPDYLKYRGDELKIMEKRFGLETKKAEVTFVSLLCRDEVLDEYFEQIPTLGLPSATHWFIMVDSDDEAFIDKIKKYQKRYEGLFLSSRMFVTGETNAAYSRDFEERGMRIANFIKVIINQAFERIGGSEFLFMVEDDTLAPKKAFKKLLPLMEDENVAYASGIECGRGWSRHTGVCTLDFDKSGEIVQRNIPDMQNKGIMPIAGGGWYCWIGRTQQLRDFIDHRPMRCIDGKMLGPDVMMVYDLVQYGFKALCDMSVQCKHYCKDQKRWLDASEGVGYRINYYQRPEDGKWRMKMYRTDGTFHEMTV